MTFDPIWLIFFRLYQNWAASGSSTKWRTTSKGSIELWNHAVWSKPMMAAQAFCRFQVRHRANCSLWSENVDDQAELSLLWCHGLSTIWLNYIDSSCISLSSFPYSSLSAILCLARAFTVRRNVILTQSKFRSLCAFEARDSKLPVMWNKYVLWCCKVTQICFFAGSEWLCIGCGRKKRNSFFSAEFFGIFFYLCLQIIEFPWFNLIRAKESNYYAFYSKKSPNIFWPGERHVPPTTW